MFEYNLTDMGSWKTKHKSGTATLYKVKDEYGYPQEDQWKWRLSVHDLTEFAEHSSYSYEDAADDLASFIYERWGVDVDWEFNGE